ncbi:hypothetical protein D6851_15385 [Altericroceibacterium spongiae]|uniref:DUF2065 family protein n=1 Tax=Altericroceibacterium spongiae TaxID=2320269 RepID=A0A420EC13_9SPHN|nr:hypothetical protein [Altericroceibacterium spongiae]RKF18239.1 hypothetical protein D6851_15385 [Altericroceibacterium spongiae]
MTPQDLPSWIALFLGLYALAAGMGELRNPGGWAAMLEDFEKSPGLRFLAGILCIGFGALIYLVCGAQYRSWLAIAMSVIGGLMVIEGVLILASGERVMGFARRFLGKAGSVWPGFSVFLGAAFILLAFARL